MRSEFRFEGGMASSSIKTAALAWARKGVRVLALHGIDDNNACTCGKSKCKSPGKHPIAAEFPNGHHSATCDPEKIERVFSKYPNANLGIVPPEGLIVLDVDGPEGLKTFRTLNLPLTLSVRSGRGSHRYFQTSEVIPKKRKKLSGIDMKNAAGGYIVVPPSKHHSGEKYVWLHKSKEIARLPESFFFSLAPKENQTVRVEFEAALKAGNRNNELTKIAGTLRYRGLGEHAIAAALQAINEQACHPPLDADEIDRIASSVSKYDVGHEHAFGWLGDVEESEPQFLAYPYIVKGAVTVLDGNMGQGKSTFTCALAAAVTTGTPPPFVDEIDKGTVLL